MMRNDRIMLECLEKEIRLIKEEVDDIERKLVILRKNTDKLTDKDMRRK